MSAWAEARSIPVPESGCWLWLGAEKGNGYGNVKEGRRNTTAHRRSWEEHNGPIPKGMHVCHKCDTRPCINPDHLFLGTRKQNMADCVAKDR
ncbi:HNH endonuclease signature motif containing protein, partial [Xanthomonas citri pv. citri]